MSTVPHPTDASEPAPLDHAEPNSFVDSEEPGDETFWQSYNRNLECPIASLLSVFAHLLVVAGLLFVILMSGWRTKDTSPVPIALVDNGFDDFGRGNPDEGGALTPISNGDNAPTQSDFEQLPNLEDIPEIKERIEQDIAMDSDLADIRIPDEKVAPLAGLAKELQNKLAQVGQRKGAGGVGRVGPGGTGSDSTRARSLRWVVRFNIVSGREYLNQLQGMGAIVVVPIPPSNKSAYVYKDLSGRSAGELATDGEWMHLAQRVQFCDYKRDVVQQVVKELRSPIETPHAFWAFFPKEWEEKLARLEREYKNKRSEDIQETVFQVIKREDGKYDVAVARQSLKD